MDAQLLLAYGADINVVDKDGVELLGLVSDYRLVVPLVAAGARIEVHTSAPSA